MLGWSQNATTRGSSASFFISPLPCARVLTMVFPTTRSQCTLSRLPMLSVPSSSWDRAPKWPTSTLRPPTVTCNFTRRIVIFSVCVCAATSQSIWCFRLDLRSVPWISIWLRRLLNGFSLPPLAFLPCFTTWSFFWLSARHYRPCVTRTCTSPLLFCLS